MADSDRSLERVRAAKAGVRRSLGPSVDVVGVGITRSDGQYALKINLARMPKGFVPPREIEGVPALFEVVGQIRKR